MRVSPALSDISAWRRGQVSRGGCAMA